MSSTEVALATSYTPSTGQLKLVHLLTEGWPPEKARKKLRITIATLETWAMRADYRAWRDSVLMAEARQHVGEVRQALLTKAKDGDVKAIELYLRAYDNEFKAKEAQSQRNYYTQVLVSANKDAPGT